LTAEVEDVVIGAGPAGLATAAVLRRRGRRSVVLDRGERIGQSWLSRYECLRLNTVRWWSGLPGLAIPRRFGRWVKAEDYAGYLDLYAKHHQLDVRLGVSVERIKRGDRGWLVSTSTGEIAARNVVVATGYDREPFIPSWPGREVFAGELLHASRYRNARPLEGRSVLVVGCGNSGADIAVDLVRGGASKVWLSARAAPQIVPRTVGGIPMQTVAITTRRLPAWVGDSVVRIAQRLAHGDLTRYGVPRTEQPVSVQFGGSDVVPVIDVDFVNTVKRGGIEVVPAVEAFDGYKVICADHSVIVPNVVIAATGYRRGLESLVGHLSVLAHDGRPLAHGPESPAGATGLFFVGYTNPLSGNLRELAIDARRTANRVAAKSRELQGSRLVSSARSDPTSSQA
jgi:putative flavoprotein involved in K+ transport